MRNIDKTIQRIKNAFDKFLTEHNAYDAWYERYRLDNLMYDDEIPIEEFIENVIMNNAIHSMVWTGVVGTCLCTNEGNKFIEDNKKCDIMLNSEIADLDVEWYHNYTTLITNND